MTIKELYEKLADKDFQDHFTGNLFFPAYMYVYEATKENEIELEIMSFKDRLARPLNYLDILIIDIFEEFILFLKESQFGSVSKYEYYIKSEQEKPAQVDKALRQDAYDARFISYLDKKIKKHLENAGQYEVAYVFVKGFGAAFPYIRASKFVNNFEQFIHGYKMIFFYPGTVKEYYNLFGILNDENLYRAIKLINQDL